MLVLLVGKLFILTSNNNITMISNLDEMKLGELLPEASEREVSKIAYRQLDKNGRLYIDVGLAKKEFLMILLDPLPEDKIRFLKAGRG
jgi:hypothetical protein